MQKTMKNRLKSSRFLVLICSLFLFTCITGAHAQITSSKGYKVLGVIKDAVTNETLPGVSIVVKGTTLGTVSDIDGSYTIECPNENSTLIFSFIGYTSKSINVSGQTKIDVNLDADVKHLEDVVVVGYGKQNRVSVIGSVTSIKSDVLLQSPVANLSNALAGRMPGLITVQNSGEPGFDGAKLYIRGVGTFNSSSPLVMVDGIERNFDQIDPNEIESINILKDASATAVYGVRGANGVILVTTRRGEMGKPEVSFRYQTGFQTPTRLSEYLDSYDNASLYNEAQLNENPSLTPDQLRYQPEALEAYKNNSDPHRYPNVDWYDKVLKKYSTTSQYNLNISGGGKIARYFVSGGFYSQNGLFKGTQTKPYDTESKFERYNFRSNIDISVTQSLSARLDLSGRVEDRNRPGATTGSIFQALGRTPPSAFPIRNEDGSFGGTGTYKNNPVGMISSTGYVNDYRASVQGTFELSQKLNFITEGLSVSGKVAFDSYFRHVQERTKEYAVYELGQDGELIQHGDDTPIAKDASTNQNRFMTNEAKLEYSRGFGAHNVSGLLLYNQTEKVYGDDIPYAYQGYVARAAYNYNNRYFIELNGGYNGSENFPKKGRFGFFPSVSLGWVLSEESFFKNNLSFVNFFKLRGSYGEVGNDQIGGRRFMYLSYYKPSGNYEFGRPNRSMDGIKEDQIGNESITWERARKSNLGIDMDLFNSKIKLGIDVFHEKRDNILSYRKTIPAITGAALPPGNLGVVTNKGVEVEMTYRDKIGNVDFYLNGNISYAKNKINFMDEPERKHEWLKRTGQSVNQPFGLVAIGFFKDQDEIDNSPTQIGTLRPGDIKYQDTNGDGKVDTFDEMPIGYSQVPEIQYGFSSAVSYKGFSISVLFQGSANSSVYLTQEAAWEFYNGGKAMKRHLGRWTPETHNTATFPRLSTNENGNNHTPVSTFWQQSADYLRLKNLEIGYDLPKDFVNKYGLGAVRVYLNGMNLYTWDSMKSGDPEAPSGRGNIYPQQKVYNIGVNVTF